MREVGGTASRGVNRGLGDDPVVPGLKSHQHLRIKDTIRTDIFSFSERNSLLKLFESNPRPPQRRLSMVAEAESSVPLRGPHFRRLQPFLAQWRLLQ